MLYRTDLLQMPGKEQEYEQEQIQAKEHVQEAGRTESPRVW